MNEPTPSGNADPSTEGFRISARPVVETNRPTNGAGAELPASYDTDLLYVTARDPNSLFLYWDVNWTRLFERARLSPRTVHLRIYRQDGSVEGTREINPFLEHCFVDVVNAGSGYYCELGSFVGESWTLLLRSGTASTPENRMSEDLDAHFATLPLHLSFQRMLDIFQAAQGTPATLAQSVGKLQEEARELRSKVTSQDWERMVAAAGTTSTNGARSSDLAALLKAALRSEKPGDPTAEQLAHWKRLGQQFGGASWGGASPSA